METLDIYGIDAEGVECEIIRNVSFQSPIFESRLCSLFYYLRPPCVQFSNRHLYVKNKFSLEF